MKKIHIQGSSSSAILIGERLQQLGQYVPHTRVVVITDENVYAHYASALSDYEVIRIGVGESSKTLETVEVVYDQLLQMEMDRSGFIVGVGGGIVCDTAGFVASTYMRGIRFGFVSTTLLSQVDASVGGKNGVNFRGYKNMIGVFNQPEFVICDLDMLKTLPTEELQNGFAEIIKHALIKDRAMLDVLEQSAGEALILNTEIIERLVYDSVKIKSDVVSQDEREKGERRKLNFGHTLAHALEKTIDISHGQAVAVGMLAAARLSLKKGLLTKAEVDRIQRVIELYQLPSSVAYDRESVVEAFGKDKKREGAELHFVLLNGIGDAVVRSIPLAEVREVLEQ